MRVASWNVNSVRSRLDQLTAWLARAAPDVICMQETKVEDDLFPHEALTEAEDDERDLSWAAPDDDEVVAGCFPGLRIVGSAAFAIDFPSTLARHYVEAMGTRDVYLHVMNSVVDWFAFAHWRDGRLVRALSVSIDGGVLEEHGERLPFEQPFWRGDHPLGDPDDPADELVPFHPLELAEAALEALFGYVLDGWSDCDCDALVDPEEVPLVTLAAGPR